MKLVGSGDDGDERIRRLYQLHRPEGIKYAAALIARPSGNKYILGVEAEEMFDEAMTLYWQNGEHLTDHGEHEGHIKHRIELVFIGWVRKANAQKRKAPGPTVSLDIPIASAGGGESEIRMDPPDPKSRHGEDQVDIEDAFARLGSAGEVAAARARYREDTYEEIAQDTGISEEGSRKRVKRASERLKKALEEDP